MSRAERRSAMGPPREDRVGLEHLARGQVVEHALEGNRREAAPGQERHDVGEQPIFRYGRRAPAATCGQRSSSRSMRTFSTATVRESGTARRWRSPTFSTELFLGSAATFARAAPRRAPSASRHASHARSPAAASASAAYGAASGSNEATRPS
jgi:hypothetical protein